MDKVDNRIVILTNNPSGMELYHKLERYEKNLYIYEDKIDIEWIDLWKPTFIISYNYKYKVSADVIERMKNNIINLHTSYLPWNRGANPNFWSFIEDSPKGVTIHNMDAGIDTGEIIIQKELVFDEENESFSSTYKKLNKEIINLLIDYWFDIKCHKILPKKQQGKGSIHKVKDFVAYNNGKEMNWDMIIADYKKYRWGIK